MIFSSCAFYSLSQPHRVTASHHSPGHNHQSTGERSEEHRAKQKWRRETHSVTYVPGLSTLSDLSRIDVQPPCTVIPLLPKATLTPCIQPNLGLPRTRRPLTSSNNTLLAIQYSSILSTCLNFPFFVKTTRLYK